MPVISTLIESQNITSAHTPFCHPSPKVTTFLTPNNTDVLYWSFNFIWIRSDNTLSYVSVFCLSPTFCWWDSAIFLHIAYLFSLLHCIPLCEHSAINLALLLLTGLGQFPGWGHYKRCCSGQPGVYPSVTPSRKAFLLSVSPGVRLLGHYVFICCSSFSLLFHLITPKQACMEHWLFAWHSARHKADETQI